MKLVKLRLTDYIITINEEECPVVYSHHEASLGFAIEVRINNSTLATYVTATVTRDGETHYAGKVCLLSYTEGELFRCVSHQAFNIADSLKIPAQHIWSLLEQFPAFSESGIRVSDAEALETPIRDLLARGATPEEVVSSLDINRDLYEFVTGGKMSPEPQPQELVGQEMSVNDGNW